MRPSRTVWITGLGVVSAAGVDVPETLSAFDQSSRNPSPVSLFETALACPVFEVPLDPFPQENGRWSRTFRLAMLAVEQALKEAGEIHRDPGRRIGVCLGTTVASQLNNMEFYRAYRRNANPPLEPVRDFLKGNLAQNVARSLGVRGPWATIVNACSSGADAIGLGLDWLRAGLCDAVIAGGADEMNRVPLCGFHSLGIVSDAPCAPFDLHRSGLNLGEGAGILVLEAASSRPEKAELVLAGYGAACDAHHLTAPHPEGRGLKRAIEAAMEFSQTSYDEVAFLNAHGTATRDNDLVEGRVLAELFGPGVVALSTKGYTGHALGGAGGMEAVFTALALREGWVPASVGFETPDPDIGIRPLRRKTGIEGPAAVSTSLAFGGNNAAIVIRRVA